MLSPAVLFSLPCAVSNLLCSILQPPHPPSVLSSPDSFSILPVLLFKLTAHLPPLDHLLPSIFSLFSVPEIRPAPDHCRGNLRCIVNTFRVHCRESSRQSSLSVWEWLSKHYVKTTTYFDLFEISKACYCMTGWSSRQLWTFQFDAKRHTQTRHWFSLLK